MLAGIGFMLFLYQEAFLSYISSNPDLTWFAMTLVSVSEYVSGFLTNLTYILQTIIGELTTVVAGGRYVLLCIAGVLAVVQFVLYKKDKVGVQ